jgi:hypothetical protein
MGFTEGEHALVNGRRAIRGDVMGREKDRRTPLPQLVATPKGFRVWDPEVITKKDDLYEDFNDRVVWQTGTTIDAVALLSTLLVGVGASLVLGAGWISDVLWFVAGVVVSGAAWLALRWHDLDDKEDVYRETHRGADPHVDVHDRVDLLDLCALVEEIAGTRAWRDGAVDPDRRLAATLWSVVSANSSTQAADVAQTRENLRELLRIAHEIEHRAVDPDHDPATTKSLEDPAARARHLSEGMLEQGRTLRDLL